jgi:hypothetical protein
MIATGVPLKEIFNTDAALSGVIEHTSSFGCAGKVLWTLWANRAWVAAS